jgi:hypothetical protein
MSEMRHGTRSRWTAIGAGIALAAMGCSGGEKPAAPVSAAPEKKSASAAPTAAGPYEVVAVSNGGTITGKVHFKGDATPVVIKAHKDQQTCHDEKTSPRLRVGPTQGLADAVVYLADIKKGADPGVLPAGSLDQKACEYSPHVQVHPWKKDFVVRSSDPILHNVHMSFADKDELVMNAPFPDAGEQKKKFKRPGVAHAKCDAGHVWMSATVFAVDHPYYAVSDSDGGYVLHDVPAGTYTLVCWHEGWKLLETQKDGSGTPTACVWSPDVETKQSVTIQPGATVPIDFTIE